MKYGLDVSIAGEYANPCMLADLAAEAEQAGWDGFLVQSYMVEGIWGSDIRKSKERIRSGPSRT